MNLSYVILVYISATFRKITNQQRMSDQDARSTFLSVNSMCICWAIKTMVNNPVFHVSNLNKSWLLL